MGIPVPGMSLRPRTWESRESTTDRTADFVLAGKVGLEATLTSWEAVVFQNPRGSAVDELSGYLFLVPIVQRLNPGTESQLPCNRGGSP